MFDWQAIVAMLMVVAAAAWMLRRVVKVFRSNARGEQVSACGSCPKSPKVTKSSPLVQLGQNLDK